MFYTGSISRIFQDSAQGLDARDIQIFDKEYLSGLWRKEGRGGEVTREKGREGERNGKVGRGQERGEGRYVILGFVSLQNLKGTPFAICDFGKKPFGGHPLRSVTLGSEFLQDLSGTPLAIYDFAIWVLQNLRGTPLVMYHLGICFMQKPLGGHPLRSMILGFVLCKHL